MRCTNAEINWDLSRSEGGSVGFVFSPTQVQVHAQYRKEWKKGANFSITETVQVFSCLWEEGDEEGPQNCYYKRNCVELDGMYVCRQGHCYRLVHY